ncbi:MAG TPA: hypothetical protein VFD94_11925 [Jatrophihabitans sp.]|nr:hypothetical protein [Jatrophihabitans sp.]
MVSHPIGHRRGQAGAAALTSAISDLTARGVPPGDPSSPLLYADRLLAADDVYGSSHGLIVQGDALGWPAVDGLVDVAAYGMLAHRQRAHQGGAEQNCPLCRQIQAMWHTALIDPVTARRRITATDLHGRARAIVLGELPG